MGGSVGGSLDIETNIEARYRTQTYNFSDISCITVASITIQMGAIKTNFFKGVIHTLL